MKAKTSLQDAVSTQQPMNKFTFHRHFIFVYIIFCLVITCFRASSQIPGTAMNQLDISNVRAGLLNGGDMFWNLSDAKFEVPKNSGKHSIFAASLWIGGLDATNNLHLAAQTYRQTGNDFFPGPVDLNGNASVSVFWDSLWKVNRSVINNHIQHWNDPGYIVPQELATWPANGQPPFASILAPFVDLNGNFIYEPALGEFPYIRGDQAVYSIFNDLAGNHGETSGIPLGIEIHQMSFEINSPDSFLNNTVFMRYEIGNRSDTSYHDLYFGIWVDFDLGNYLDDYVGTDVGRNMIYAYNADSDDEGTFGYGINPPAQGMMFLGHNISHSMYYNNTGGNDPTGNPNGAADVYNYLKSIWRDGLPVTFGGDGRNQSSPACSFMFPGTTDPAFPSQNWTEVTAGNIPGDRRMLASIGPINLPADSFFVVDVAFPWARGYSGPQSSVAALQQAADSIANRYAAGQLFTTGISQPLAAAMKLNSIRIAPNPASSHCTVYFPNPGNELFSLCISDITGRVVMNKSGFTGNSVILDISTLPAGIFTILLQSPQNIYTDKIVIR